MAIRSFLRYMEVCGRPRVIPALIILVSLAVIGPAIYIFDGGLFLDSQLDTSENQTDTQDDNTEKHPLTYALLSVLLGISLSLLVTEVLMGFLEWPALRNIPRKFRKAAFRELLEPGYYRYDNKFSIELDNSKLQITASSIIVSTRKRAIMKPPNVAPPDNLCLHKVKYSHDKKDVRHFAGKKGTTGFQFIRLPRWTREKLKIIYRLKDGMSLSELEEKHRYFSDVHHWTSPVADFELTATIPVGFRIAVFILDGLGQQIVPEIPSRVDGERRFVHRKAAFSYQGFRWRIGPDAPNRCPNNESDNATNRSQTTGGNSSTCGDGGGSSR